MPIRNYTIPGTEATIIDYQIAPAPITNPGDIVILLGDLPDTVSLSDPLNPGSFISLDIPSNQPLIINQETQLGAISSTEFRTALITLGESERSLEMINVLPILNSSLPLALCKITKRNGERPEQGNMKDYYEALEYAYESLANYPAGRIVPMHVSIEDDVLMEQLSNLGVEVYDRVNFTSTSVEDYGSALFNIVSSSVDFSITDIDLIKTFTYNVTPVFDYAGGADTSLSPDGSVAGAITEVQSGAGALFEFYLGANNNGIPFHKHYQKLTIGATSAEIPYLRPGAVTSEPLVQVLGGWVQAYKAVQDKVVDPDADKILLDISNSVGNEEDLYKFISMSSFATSIGNLTSLEDYIILDQTSFKSGSTLNNLDQYPIAIDIKDGETNIGKFNCTFQVNHMTSGIVVDSTSVTYEESNLNMQELICIERLGEGVVIDPSDWYIGGILNHDQIKFWFTDDPATKPDGEIIVVASDMDSALAIPKTDREFTPGYHSYSAATRIDDSYDRSFNTVYRYDIGSESYSSDMVGITINKDQNFVSKSVSLTIERFVPDSTDTSGVMRGGNLFINGEASYLEQVQVIAINAGRGGYIVQNDYDVEVEGLVTFTLKKGLVLPYDPTDPTSSSLFEYEISIVPNGADFSNRAVQFCEEMTSQLNDCTVVMGTYPPATVSPEDIEEQVERLRLNLGGKTFIGTTADNGLYISVTTGSQKVSQIGGISNFPSARVASFNPGSIQSNTPATVSIIGALEFKPGDNIDLEITKRGRIYVVENSVASVTKTTAGYEITLNETFENTLFGNINLNSSRTVSLTNLKDSKGTYLAALYAVESNNYGIDKAPFNHTMPGDGEIFYTRDQLNRLLDTNLTPISRNAFNTSATVIDTPTMAQDSSDFTDQGTVGLIMYFINQLRAIAAPRKGQRFGSGARQIAFQTELEAPFEAQVGDTILAYNLVPDWNALQTEETLNIEFSIREAKKLKVVKITAKLF